MDTISVLALVFGTVGFVLGTRLEKTMRDVQRRIEALEQRGSADETTATD